MSDATVTSLDVKPSRRAVLAGTGALVLTVGAMGLAGIARSDPATDGIAPNIWVRISADGTVTVVFPATEMGQGSSTSLPLILAEEMDADWDRVRVEQLDRDDRAYGNPIFGNVLYTAGSTAVAAYFTPLRLAGAQARQVLIRAAARHWGVAPDGLKTEPGLVVNPANGKRLGYGEIAALPDVPTDVPEVPEADLKPRSAYRLIGKDIPRRDAPAKSRGTETYVIDVRVPNMAYASVLRAPVEGETPQSIDEAAARAISGVLDVVRLPDGVAVVAERLETAFAARDALSVTWSELAPARKFDNEADLEAYARAVARPQDKPAEWRAEGDAENALANGGRVIEAEYRSDYAYHAQLEPMAAVASVTDEGAEVWAGTQTQSWTTRTVTDVLGIPADKVRVHMMTMGGGFGRRTALMQEYVRDALLSSRAVGRPVKVVWTREDDLRHGWFRPASVQLMSAAMTNDGTLEAWRHRVATPSVIKYFNPLRWSQVAPKDIVSMRGSESKHYKIPHFLAEHVITERRARIIPWRGIGAAYTSFAAEAFMDELASAAGEDPIAFRLKLLTHNPRGARLLERVSEMAGWGRKPGETALGVAFAGYGNTMAAGIAEVAVDRETSQIRVPRFWAAIDGGLVIAPRNAEAQIEGGIVFGLSSSLKERVTIRDGEVEQSNFHDYEILRADEVPEIEIAFEVSDAPPSGMGEAGTPMVAAAVANGFHALTGRRLRHMPFTPERVLAALA